MPQTLHPSSQDCSITMLGTGNAMAVNCYNTCFYLRSPGGGLLVDAGGGNGILRQLQRAQIPYERVRHLFITHCHTDHIMGAVWLVRKISPLIHKHKFRPPFTIYGHKEVCETLEAMCRMMIPEKICSAFDLGTIVLRTVQSEERIMIDDLDVTFFDIGSTKTKQFGFNAVLPGSGRRVVCLGDEPYNPMSDTWAVGADWLLCEAFCLYRDCSVFNPYEKFHSTALDAGLIAQQLGVHNLLLYHSEDQHLDTRRTAYAAEAQRYFNGMVYVPDDLETVPL